jgi:hypothetical protein
MSRAAAGGANTATTLYRNASSGRGPRPHRARESLFVTIAGSPATGALLGLADLAAARGDAEMRARAELAVA